MTNKTPSVKVPNQKVAEVFVYNHPLKNSGVIWDVKSHHYDYMLIDRTDFSIPLSTDLTPHDLPLPPTVLVSTSVPLQLVISTFSICCALLLSIVIGLCKTCLIPLRMITA